MAYLRGSTMGVLLANDKVLTDEMCSKVDDSLEVWRQTLESKASILVGLK